MYKKDLIKELKEKERILVFTDMLLNEKIEIIKNAIEYIKEHIRIDDEYQTIWKC